MQDEPPLPETPLSRLPTLLRWLLLLVSSALLAVLFEIAGLPAGLLIGPMTVSYTHLDVYKRQA